jgi:hypothetical protein
MTAGNPAKSLAKMVPEEDSRFPPKYLLWLHLFFAI